LKIVIVNKGYIPVLNYGGTERVVWALGKELAKLGHEVIFMVKAGSTCDFAKVLAIDESKSILEQLPKNIDIVHFNFTPQNIEQLTIPHVITIHGNSNFQEKLSKNAIFLSKNHAERHNSTSFVYNGLDWDEYTPPTFKKTYNHFHFLGNAAWRVKNVQGAIDIVTKIPSAKLHVLGGTRLNLKMGFRLTLSPKVRFHGMVGGQTKFDLLNKSSGLIFPVLWHEPFGLAVIESLFYGSPVFSTPYGSLPELINNEFGFLSNNKVELVQAIKNIESYKPTKCHEYAKEVFNSKNMALAYLKKYEEVLNGRELSSTTPYLLREKQAKFLHWN
jgi:glycosyltransferase involved in cell wall biosynthesis